MTAIEKELENIKELTVGMMELVKEQLKRSCNALMQHDTRLASDILRYELRVNELELTIEKACEQVIALHQPVATELRFILAVFKAVSELERLADHVEGIARVLLDKEVPFNPETLAQLETEAMYSESEQMFDDIINSLNDQDTDLARTVFKRDKFLNKTFKRSTQNILEQLRDTSDGTTDSSELLRLFQVLYRLERIGDLLTNVAELIIFYLEAVVIKHKKKRKRVEKKIAEISHNHDEDGAEQNPKD